MEMCSSPSTVDYKKKHSKINKRNSFLFSSSLIKRMLELHRRFDVTMYRLALSFSHSFFPFSFSFSRMSRGKKRSDYLHEWNLTSVPSERRKTNDEAYVRFWKKREREREHLFLSFSLFYFSFFSPSLFFSNDRFDQSKYKETNTIRLVVCLFLFSLIALFFLFRFSPRCSGLLQLTRRISSGCSDDNCSDSSLFYFEINQNLCCWFHLNCRKIIWGKKTIFFCHSIQFVSQTSDSLNMIENDYHPHLSVRLIYECTIRIDANLWITQTRETHVRTYSNRSTFRQVLAH